MSDEPQPTLKRKRPTVDDPPPPAPNPNLEQERRELTDAEQLAKTMSEIKALSGDASPPSSLGTTQESSQAPPAPVEPPAAPFNLNWEKAGNPRAEPEEVKQPPASLPVVTVSAPGAFAPYDVVQVYNNESRYYGVLFQVGEMKEGSVHGYFLKEGGKREFITVKAGEIKLIGESRVRLRQPCSGKWLSEHRELK